MITIEQIAEICHEANRQYCQALGDDSQKGWRYAPKWQKESTINGVQFHLNNPTAGPQASHENWLAEKEADGWVFGEEKDAKAKTHPCCVPFAELPQAQQAKDVLFRGTVHALAALVEGYEDYPVDKACNCDVCDKQPGSDSQDDIGPGEVVQAYEPNCLPCLVILNNKNPAFIGIKQGDKMLLSAQLEQGSKILVKGHVQYHLDYPRKDNVELMEL